MHTYTHTHLHARMHSVQNSDSCLLTLFSFEDFSLGGQSYWAGALHLYGPIPVLSWVSGQRIKLHSFLTGGNLSASGNSNSDKEDKCVQVHWN